MSSSRKKWNADKKVEMERLHKYLADEGSPFSQLFIAKTLLREARQEGNNLKSEMAIEMLIEASNSGDPNAIFLLSECFSQDIGITDTNRHLVLVSLSTNIKDFQINNLVTTLLTTISDEQRKPLKESQFRQTIQRLVLQTNCPLISSAKDSEDQIIYEEYLKLNVSYVLKYNSPLIDLTEQNENLFQTVHKLLLVSVRFVDFSLMTSLLLVLCLSLICSYIFFEANLWLIYQSFFSLQTVCLSLQLFEMYFVFKIIDRINHFHNYRLWVKVLKAFDKDLSIDMSKYFWKGLFWTLTLLTIITIELYLNLITGKDVPTVPTLYTSVIRQLIVLLLFMTSIKNNSNLLQIFLIIFHYLSLIYLQEFRPYFLYFDFYLTDYILIISILIVIISTKPLFSHQSLNMIIVPNLLAHVLISCIDLSSESLNFILDNILVNIHTIFGTTFLIIILSYLRKLYILSKFPIILIFIDIYKQFAQTFDWKWFFFFSIVLNQYSTKIRSLSIIRKTQTIFLTLILSFLILQIISYNPRQIRSISKNAYSYDRYYDKCFDSDIKHNISKQIECLDITFNYKLQALSAVNSIKVLQIRNYLKNTLYFLTFGLNDYLSDILIKNFTLNYNLNNWRVYEYELILLLKHSNSEVTVHLKHQNRDFVDKLKVGDIYEIEIIYDPIRSTAILLSAECKTCWDVIKFTNTIYS